MNISAGLLLMRNWEGKVPAFKLEGCRIRLQKLYRSLNLELWNLELQNVEFRTAEVMMIGLTLRYYFCGSKFYQFLDPPPLVSRAIDSKTASSGISSFGASPHRRSRS